MRTLVSLLIVVLAGCSQPHGQEGSPVETGPSWAEACEAPMQVDQLHGLDGATLAARLGEPERKETFRVGERQDEFHVQIQNTYPLPASADVEIQEWTWAAGDCRLTVWLHAAGDAWTSFGSLRWPKGAEF